MLAEQALSRTLLDAFVETTRTFDLSARIAHALKSIPRSGRVVVLAIGKSAAAMTDGLVRADFDCNEIVIARPARSLPLASRTQEALLERGCAITSFATSHPIPDNESVRAAHCIRDTLATLSARDTVIVLLSGGASASMCLPRDGLSLDDLRLATRTLLAHGASIDAVNAVRGGLDATKHGGLLDLANGARVHTLIAADVLGDDEAVLHTVGSAPTVPSLRRALDDSLLARLPPHIARVARLSFRVQHTAASAPIIVARPTDFRDACAELLRAHGLIVTLLPDARGDIDSVGRDYQMVLERLAPGHCALAIGEPTVHLPDSPGRGGRAGRLALALVPSLAGLPGTAFCAAASDGVDGESGHAGAVVAHDTFALATTRGIDLRSHLAAFDDAVAHEALGTCVDVLPTGLNLLDVHILARA